MVNLLPKTDLELKNIFVPFIGNDSQLYTQIFDVDLNGSATEIDKLGDEMRKGVRVVIYKLGSPDWIHDYQYQGTFQIQILVLHPIQFVRKCIRALETIYSSIQNLWIPTFCLI